MRRHDPSPPFPPLRRLLVIGNPAAGLRRRAGLPAELCRRLRSDGFEAGLIETAGPGEATAAAREAALSGRCDAVIAVGGDGTAHEAANGLIGTEVALGVAPAGTMNILARELGLPLDPLESVRDLRSLRPRPVCTGRAGERHFLLMAGAGFDACALNLALQRAGSGKVTFPGYTLAALRTGLQFDYEPFEIVADGERLTGTSAIIGNVPRYGGNLRVTPRADPLEPALDLCLFLGRGLLAYASVFLAILRGGRHTERADILYRKAVRIEIPASRRPVPLQLDGEPAGRGPVAIEARPGSLRLLAPPGWRS